MPRECSIKAVVRPPIPPPTMIAFIATPHASAGIMRPAATGGKCRRRLTPVPVIAPNKAKKRDFVGSKVMRRALRGLVTAAACAVVVNGAAAQDKVRIGLIYTLSGPAAALGQQSKNG